jgi:hypothetical protein
VRDERPLKSGEIRRFGVQTVALVAVMGLVYWLGWKSPWARADLHVRVEAPDAQRAIAAPPPNPPVIDPVPQPEAASPQSSEEEPKQPRRHRRHPASDSLGRD